MKQKLKKLIQEVGVMSLALTIAFVALMGVTIARGWVDALSPPPIGNIGAPLNTSGSGQVKQGGLTLGSGLGATDNGLIVQNGLVGIGTITPAVPLDVVSTTGTVQNTYYGSANARFALRTATGTASAPGAVANGTRLGAINFQGFDGSSFLNGSQILADVDNTVSSGKIPTALKFTTMDTNGTNAERMRITDSGSVGIGTASPAVGVALDVNGIIHATTPSAGDDNAVVTEGYLSAAGVGTAQKKRVFVTSTIYNGNLGGLAGADSQCQARANAASLGGTWKAILSAAGADVINRIGINREDNKVIVDMKNHPIATAFEFFGFVVSTNYLRSSILYNEFGQSMVGPTQYEWTGSSDNGIAVAPNCSNWTSSSSTSSGEVGQLGYIGAGWLYYAAYTCNNTYNLFCIEQ